MEYSDKCWNHLKATPEKNAREYLSHNIWIIFQILAKSIQFYKVGFHIHSPIIYR